MKRDPLPHLGRAGTLPCKCGNTGVCAICRVHNAIQHLQKVYYDDTKRAAAVHEVIAAIKEAAKE